MIPRAQSDPGTPRLDSIWKQKTPPLPSHVSFAPVKPYRSKQHRHSPRLHAIPEYEFPKMTSISSLSRQNGLLLYEPSRSIGIQCPSVREPAKSIGIQCPSTHVYSEVPEPQFRRRNWVMQIISWPWDCVESGLRVCFPISEETLRFLRATWYVVVIFSTVLGIITAIFAPNRANI